MGKAANREFQSSAMQPSTTRDGTRAAGAHVSEFVWGPLAGGALIGAVGAISIAVGQPWLFPSLGPTAYLQAERPDLKSSRFYNVVVGHLAGLGSGVLAVIVCGAANAPPVMSSHELSPVRLGAAVLAVALTMLVGALLRASHPPAAATALLVALGGMKVTGSEAGIICMGVLLVAILGEAVRQFRLRHLEQP